ncbi:MAG: GDP-mannose 4,6-dehydratase, partial [Bacteroidota bacterium]
KLTLGNMDAKRDWGYAPEFVDAMWRMLQQDAADDFVVATGETHTVREFTEIAFREVGIELRWEGTAENEKGLDAASGKILVEVSPSYYRPTEVELLIGDPTKAREKLGWEPQVKFEELVRIMAAADLEKVKRRGY